MLRKNENIYDRLLRVLLAELLFMVAYFWMGGIARIILYVLSGVSLVTGLTGYCHLYSVLKFSTLKSEAKKANKIILSLFVIVLLVLPIVASYYSVQN